MPLLHETLAGGPLHTPLSPLALVSAKHPHDVHHVIVPDLAVSCFLPAPSPVPQLLSTPAVSFIGLFGSSLAVAPTQAFAAILLHLPADRFAFCPVLALHTVQNHPFPEATGCKLCPPCSRLMVFFVLGVRRFLPSMPFFAFSRDRFAASACHREASESRNGNSLWLFAS